MCSTNNSNAIYNDYYKALQRDESSVVITNYSQHNGSQHRNTTVLNNYPEEDDLNSEPEPIATTSADNIDCDHKIFRPSTLHIPIRPALTITTPNGAHHSIRQTPGDLIKKSHIELSMSEPSPVASYMSCAPSHMLSNQYYTRVMAQQSDAEEKYLYNTYERQYKISDDPAQIVRDLRWIHWRMTLFVFYWIVWFIGLIIVIIIVAYRAKV